MSARGRLRQLFSALNAQLSADEYALVAQLLSSGELKLFMSMPRFDQRHCMDVYRTLVRSGYTDPALLKAALLHDCGKVDDSRRAIPLIYYGAFVILKRLAPTLYTWAADNGRGPFQPFAIHRAHEQRSAELAQAAGSAPELLAILRDYATKRSTAETRALNWADEQH